MPDIHHPGPVLPLPLLGTEHEDRLETDLTAWTRDRPLALILPCHARDLESEAMGNILDTLSGVPWISRLILGLDGANAAAYASALQKTAILPFPREVLHHPSPPGKGRNLQDCVARLLQDRSIFAAALHDCDIRTYSRGFLARLCWPVLHPDAGLRACKGYYARNSRRLHGRVFRLMFQPLLRAWAEQLPGHPWVLFLQSLRYPLSGELCVETSLLRRLPLDAGWGVEVSVLHGLYRHAAPGEICQAELCAAYDHKHHAPPLLTEMAGEVASTLARVMIQEGWTPDQPRVEKLTAAHTLHVAAAVRASALTARLNGLEHDLDEETALAAHMAAATASRLAAL